MKIIKNIILPIGILSSMLITPITSFSSTPPSYTVYKNVKKSNAQKEVLDVIMKYQKALNAGNTKEIISLYANESYSQWNNLLTADSKEKKEDQYNNLFSKEKFNTDFAIDTIWVDGNTAFVRTHHHNGSVVTDTKEQKTILDLNREVFILHKENGEWKIILYTFNTNPLQGVA
ncbi:hypothetical protein AHYW_004251 [Providencia manganoxydans]|uniref:YybH family protein n=1 Tax=Providencia TaxID=586 RepID=UPI0011241323|nr:nuclear transport factor 2 family protein [Providencia stuartii]